MLFNDFKYSFQIIRHIRNELGIIETRSEIHSYIVSIFIL